MVKKISQNQIYYINSQIYNIINQYCDDDVIIQQLIRDETEIVAQSAKLWKHELENDIILNTGTPDLMYQTIGLLMDCFINGINKNKKRAQCLMQGKEGCSDITVKIKKEDSKYLENEMKEDGFEVTIGNDFCYKSIMDNMKTVHDKLEMYYDYL